MSVALGLGIQLVETSVLERSGMRIPWPLSIEVGFALILLDD